MPNDHTQPTPGPTFLDLYELTMADIYLGTGIAHQTATFSLFIRGYPANRSYYIASGTEAACRYLENLTFNETTIDYFRKLGVLSEQLLNQLLGTSFTGNVNAVPEGTIIFDSEPVIEVTAPLLQAQLVETALLNLVTTATLLATKASRIVQAAKGRPVIDMGARRAHGTNAALTAARASYIAGFKATTLTEAAKLGIPVTGTIAHSYIQAMPNELTAFREYLRLTPNNATLLVDTYDVASGIQNAVTAALEIKKRGGNIAAVRIDSGNLNALSRVARNALDNAGLNSVQIVASGGLDEYEISRLLTNGAPIDAFGVGTRFTASADAPYLNSAYKLVEFNGNPVYKLSEGKRTLPYGKQVLRNFSQDGMMHLDTIRKRSSTTSTASLESLPLTRQVMDNGKRLTEPENLTAIRNRCANSLESLPEHYRRLSNPDTYPVEIDPELTSAFDL